MSNVLIYSTNQDGMYPLAARLRREQFNPIVAESLRDFVAEARKQKPDIMIIRIASLPRDVATTLHFLSRCNISFYQIPAFLLVRHDAVRRLSPLLKLGLEDILDLRCELDYLMVKIKKVREQSVSDSATGKESEKLTGSRGNLSEMNIIDLLQALGPSQRTARIEVTPGGDAPPLTMYLNKGNIIFAKLGDLTGENAVFEALAWQDGVWVSEPVQEGDLPVPNNTMPNEAILMEGCRLLDERTKEAPAQ